MNILKVAVLIGLSGPVLGIPDSARDLSNLVEKLDGRSGIGQIIGDRESQKVVYVRPLSKNFIGDFTQVGGGVSCHELHENRVATFRYPNETEIQRVLNRHEAYSPAFESSFGVFARNSKITNDIQNLRSEILTYTRENKEIYGIYKQAKESYDGKKMRLNALELKDKSLDSQLNSKLALVSTEEDKKEIISTYKREKADLSHQLSFLYQQVESAHYHYANALRDWAPYKDELEWLQGVENSLIISFERIQSLADSSLRRSRSLIEALENKPIGYASASYNFDASSEIKTLRDAIQDLNLPSYNVLSLPVFDVRLNTGVNISMNGRVDNFSYQFENYNYSSDLDRHHPGAKVSTYNFKNTVVKENDDEGSLLIDYPNLENSFSDGRARAFKFPVTLGAFCGYPKSKKVTYSYTDDAGNVHQEDVMRTVYESPAPGQAIFSQHVGLRYKYFEAAAPIKGKCRMDINQASSYHRSRGSNSSWRWFKKVTHRWDDTTHNLANKMGISCEITEAPTSVKPEDMNKANEELKNMLYQDMYSMFIMTYAKDYDLEVTKPEHGSGRPQVFGNLGQGIMNICGANQGCQIANVVLKALDDLVGVRHSGSTSSRITSTGVLTREMNLNTFIVNEDSVNFKMKVCVDQTLCK